MASFYTIVVGIALIALIVSLIVVGVKVSKSSSGEAVVPDACPDYWYNAYYDVTGDPVEDSKQMNLASSYGDELTRTSKCYNVKKLGNNKCKSISSMDFSGEEWNGSQGLCKKQKWARVCGITWDGVTTEPNVCE